MRQPSKKIFISAGESSGDLWGALLVQALRRLDPDIHFVGMGLKKMEAEGVSLSVPPETLAKFSVVGGIEHLGKLPGALRLRKTCLQTLKQERPQIAVLIDFPGFHLSLLKKIHALGIPVIYYAPPQVWLWGRWRLKKLKRYCRRLLVFFPFEENFYREAGLNAQWVGHPLWHNIAQGNGSFHPSLDRIAMLPGSRANIIRHNLPPMLAAARILYRANPKRRFLLPVAPMISNEFIRQFIPGDQDYVELAEQTAVAVFRSCGSAMVVTGTAALEAALCNVPLVQCGKISAASYWTARRLLGIETRGIVNRLAGRTLIPELWQGEVTGTRVAAELEALLGDARRYQATLVGLKEIQEKFSQKEDASLEAAKVISQNLSNSF